MTPQVLQEPHTNFPLSVRMDSPGAVAIIIMLVVGFAALAFVLIRRRSR